MDLTLNSVDVTVINPKFNIFVQPPETERGFKAYRDDFRNPEELADYSDEEFIWWDLSLGQQVITLDHKNNYKLTKIYYMNLLEKELRKHRGILTGHSFFGALSVYQRKEEIQDEHLIIYDVFNLNFHYDFDKETYELVIAYGGKSLLLSEPWRAYNQISPEMISRVLYKNQVCHFKSLSDEEQNDLDNIYLFLNREIAIVTEVNMPRFLYPKERNPYLNYRQAIEVFAKRYLFNKKIHDLYLIRDTGFKRVESERIGKTSQKSNLLAFSEEQTSFNVYTGLKQFGPLHIPDISNLKFFFIFHQDDRNIANQLFSYLNRGFKGFPGLEAFVGLPFNLENFDKNHSIQFSEELPSNEVQNRLTQMQLNTDEIKYIAVYISRIDKDDPNPQRKQEYFKIKEMLLKKNISSQVILRDSIISPTFNYFLPNIAIALLAKAGGKPWTLRGQIYGDLIVGIGAYRSGQGEFIGNAICFSNDGSFEEFDAFHRDGISALGDAFCSSILNFVKSNRNAKRLVVHFYKDMNRREERYLERILANLNIKIPFAVLSITDSASRDFVVFDEDFSGKMPVSGTFVKLTERDYLICNNARYEEKTATRIDQYPLPIKIRFSRSRGLNLRNTKIVLELLDQVYQFSRLYWRSIRQKGRPVTVGYSKILAEMASHFDQETLPDTSISRKTLWFL